MVVGHNIPALFTHLSMRRADRSLGNAMMRLSTGVRINSAREDAAGLAIANKLNYQVGGLNRASQNASHGISLIQTAEGALNEVHNMLQRMRELAVYASTDTLTNANRELIHSEIEQLTSEIHLISSRTEFNRMRILNGEADRITESLMQPSGAVTRAIATPLFMSPSIQPGRLEYEIVSVGEHAVVPGINIPPTGVPSYPASINVNGTIVSVIEGETTWTGFMERFNIALGQSGIRTYTDTSGPAHFLVSHIAGSNQSININGSDSLMTSLFGSTAPISESGTDAEINIIGLENANGDIVPGSESLTAHAEGNKIFIRGSRGEDIRLNIQVGFDPTTGAFAFGNGDPAPDSMGGAPQEMSLEIRSFGPIMLQIGPSHNTAMPVQIPRLNAETLGLVEYVGGVQRLKINLQNGTHASNAISITDNAIHTVSQVRSRLGAFQNRLESTVQSLDVAEENTEQSRSRIQDADIARESTRLAQYNVMFQAAMAVLTQANQRPQQLISILQ